jgi:hypothetical protein
MPRSFALGNVTGSACRLTDREWSSHLLARSPGHRSRRQAVASRANQFLIATGRKAYQERVGTRSCGGTRARRRATFETGAVWWPEAGGVRHLRLFVSRTQSRDSRRAAHAQGRARADEDDSAKPLLERKAMVTCRELRSSSVSSGEVIGNEPIRTRIPASAPRRGMRAGAQRARRGSRRSASLPIAPSPSLLEDYDEGQDRHPWDADDAGREPEQHERPAAAEAVSPWP